MMTKIIDNFQYDTKYRNIKLNTVWFIKKQQPKNKTKNASQGWEPVSIINYTRT